MVNEARPPIRRAKRSGRERGCWVYVPAEHLVECGLNPHDPPPDYRLILARRKLTLELYEATG